MARNSFQGHTARIHKDYRTKTRTHGQRIYKNDPGFGSRKKAPRPQENAGLCMGKHEIPRRTTRPAFSPAVCRMIDRQLRACQRDLVVRGLMTVQRAYSTPMRHEIERQLCAKYEHLRVD